MLSALTNLVAQVVANFFFLLWSTDQIHTLFCVPREISAL